MKKLIFLLSLISYTLIGVSAQTETLGDLIGESRPFSEFAALIAGTEVEDLLSDPDETLTVFIPTNRVLRTAIEEGFPELGLTFNDLGEEAITQILQYHIVDGSAVSESALDSMTTLPTLLEDAELTLTDGDLINDTVSLNDRTFEASNGFIHLIDGVLVPSGLLESNIEPCTITVTTSDSARVRVGPGENRTAILFLTADEVFEVIGTNTDDSGVEWYKLDKDAVAPDRPINEAWVNANEV